MEKLPFTEIGLNKLKKEMSDLKSTERPAVIKAIAEARSHGDLSENAEYHAARERQGFIEGRLLELENVISRAEIIDLNKIKRDLNNSLMLFFDAQLLHHNTFLKLLRDQKKLIFYIKILFALDNVVLQNSQLIV